MARPTETESAALLAQAQDEGYWFRAKEEIVREFLRPHVGSSSTVLVLGVGNGATVARLRELAPSCHVTGLDIDLAAVEVASMRDPSGTYRRADLEIEPVRHPETYDVAIALDVVEHVRDDAGLVQRVAETLRPSGLFVLNVPAHPWLYSAHDAHLGHVRRYTPREIERLVRAAGLEIVRSTPLFLSTMLLVIAWRKVLQDLLGLRRSTSDVALRLPRVIDATLYALARAEGALAHRGHLPFGSSHFILARKPPRSVG